jgi:hypothetical protein
LRHGRNGDLGTGDGISGGDACYDRVVERLAGEHRISEKEAEGLLDLVRESVDTEEFDALFGELCDLQQGNRRSAGRGLRAPAIVKDRGSSSGEARSTVAPQALSRQISKFSNAAKVTQAK